MSVFTHEMGPFWVTGNFHESPLEIYGSPVMISFEIKTCTSLAVALIAKPQTTCAPPKTISIISRGRKTKTEN